MDWNNKYTCENWAEKFNLTYPILDDSRGNRIYNYFGNGVVPYNIVLDKDRRLIYSSSGFNRDEIVKAINIGLGLSKKEKKFSEKIKLARPKKSAYKQLRENKGLN